MKNACKHLREEIYEDDPYEHSFAKCLDCGQLRTINRGYLRRILRGTATPEEWAKFGAVMSLLTKEELGVVSNSLPVGQNLLSSWRP